MDMLVNEGELGYAHFERQHTKEQLKNEIVKTAKRHLDLTNMDMIYVMFAEAVNHNRTLLFKEDLGNVSDFRDDEFNHVPILDHKKVTIEDFRTPGEPYLVHEFEYDNKTKRIERLIKNSPLAGNGDVSRLYRQIEFNNSFIMRGVHITVRDEDGNLITDEYGIPNSPLPDPRPDFGKVLWYRPSEYMHPDYTDGDEYIDGKVVMKYDHIEDYDFHKIPDKRKVFFQRIKRSNFLPRCLRETLVTVDVQTHSFLRCGSHDQEPVADEFYKRLGIEKNKTYIFEYMNVW